MLPTSGGQALMVLLARAAGHDLPITPVQILWSTWSLGRAGAGYRLRADRVRLMAVRRATCGEPLLSRFLVWRIAFVTACRFASLLWYVPVNRARHEPGVRPQPLRWNTLVSGGDVHLQLPPADPASVLPSEGFGNPIALGRGRRQSVGCSWR